MNDPEKKTFIVNHLYSLPKVKLMSNIYMEQNTKYLLVEKQGRIMTSNLSKRKKVLQATENP